MMTKKFSFVAALLSFFLLATIPSCSDDDDKIEPPKENVEPEKKPEKEPEKETDTEPEKKPDDRYIIQTSINPYDPILLNIYSKEGDTIYVSGEKTPEGYAKKVNSLIIKQKGQENPAEFIFDEKNRFKHIVCTNGVVMKFEWLSDEEAALTLIEPNTGEQLNTVYNIKANSKSFKSIENVPIKKRTGKLDLKLCPIDYTNFSQQPTRTDESNRTYTYSISMCGEPFYGRTYVDLYHASKRVCRVEGRPTKKPGEYSIIVPKDAVAEHAFEPEKYASHLVDILDIVCTGMSGYSDMAMVCSFISVSLAAAVVSAPAAATFEAACLTSSALLNLYCNTLAVGIPGGDSPINGLVKYLEKFEIRWIDVLTAITKYEALPKDKCFKSYDIDIVNDKAGNHYHEFPIDFAPKISQFKLYPSKPKAGKSYKAVATLRCMIPGSVVTIDVVGTDGYTDQETMTITEENRNCEAILTVPGAVSKVKDVCTIKIVMPDGSTLTKTASLIFL